MTDACWLSSLPCQSKQSLRKQQASVLIAITVAGAPHSSQLQSVATTAYVPSPSTALRCACIVVIHIWVLDVVTLRIVAAD